MDWIEEIKPNFNEDNSKHPKRHKKLHNYNLHNWRNKFGHKTINGVGIVGRLRKKRTNKK